MTTAILASAALKPIFEERPDTLKDLGLDESVLGPIMSHLTNTYTQAAEFELAAKAAKVLGNADDYRVVFNAMKSSEVSAHYFQNCHIHDDYVFVLLQVGTEAELREHAAHDDGDVAVEILKHLKDATGLAAFGRKLEDLYYTTHAEEKRKKMSSSDTDYLLDDAITAYTAAAELGNEQMPQELMRFGDRLMKHDGVRASYQSRLRGSMFYDSPRPHPLAEAYEANGTPEGFRKAAAVYLDLSKSEDTYGDEKKNEYMVLAAEAFIEAQDFEAALVIASQLAAREDIASAIQIAMETPNKVDFALLEQYALGAIQEATGSVKQTILDYLKEHGNLMPFLDHYTFWCDSLSNDTWKPCVSHVNYMAGRFDKSRIRLRRGHDGGDGSIAKHLYASDKAEVIKKINNALTRHLFAGWMLSGITYEMKHGANDRSRKYEHPSYAAWRTFDEVGRHERKNVLGLPSDTLVNDLHQYLHGVVEDEWQKLQDEGYKPNATSMRFIASKLAEMQTRTKQVYETVSKEVEGLVARL